mgnify:CR=1 FL=1
MRCRITEREVMAPIENWKSIQFRCRTMHRLKVSSFQIDLRCRLKSSRWVFEAWLMIEETTNKPSKSLIILPPDDENTLKPAVCIVISWTGVSLRHSPLIRWERTPELFWSSFHHWEYDNFDSSVADMHSHPQYYQTFLHVVGENAYRRHRRRRWLGESSGW